MPNPTNRFGRCKKKNYENQITQDASVYIVCINASSHCADGRAARNRWTAAWGTRKGGGVGRGCRRDVRSRNAYPDCGDVTVHQDRHDRNGWAGGRAQKNCLVRYGGLRINARKFASARSLRGQDSEMKLSDFGRQISRRDLAGPRETKTRDTVFRRTADAGYATGLRAFTGRG